MNDNSISGDGFWFTMLDDSAQHRSDQRSFHTFAEGDLGDVRGQIYNLAENGELSLPSDGWPRHMFIVIAIRGSLNAIIDGRELPMRPLSQLIVLPGNACKLASPLGASLEVISFCATSGAKDV